MKACRKMLFILAIFHVFTVVFLKLKLRWRREKIAPSSKWKTKYSIEMREVIWAPVEKNINRLALQNELRIRITRWRYMTAATWVFLWVLQSFWITLNTRIRDFDKVECIKLDKIKLLLCLTLDCTPTALCLFLQLVFGQCYKSGFSEHKTDVTCKMKTC